MQQSTDCSYEQRNVGSFEVYYPHPWDGGGTVVVKMSLTTLLYFTLLKFILARWPIQSPIFQRAVHNFVQKYILN